MYRNHLNQAYDTVSLKETVLSANTGADAIKRAPIVEYETDYRCLRIGDISNNRSFENWGYTTADDSVVEKFLLKKDDIIIARTGSTIGVSKYIYKDMPSLFNNGLIRLRIDKEKYNPLYIYYNLQTINFEGFINAISSGTSTQPNMKIKDLLEYRITDFPLSIQNSIVNILSSFDAKIENNNAIITNLEEQAQAIFKSWFVDFEPFQDEEFVESEIGNIPRNWEVGQLGNSKLGELKSSGIEDFEGEKIYIATADVEGTWINSENTGVTYEDKPSRANMQPTPYSVWFAKMKDSRKLILVDNFDKYLLDNMIFSTGFAGIQCNKLSVYYLWEFIKSNYFDEVKNQYSTGTTMQAINNKNINQILVIIPPQIVLSKFNSILHPINNKISLLKRENITLAEARDTLLPKLMSGEIRVEDTIEVKEM